ncbi:hypothetical protein [Salipaludibacillus neizhouensis]|uniref:hypothetical protein n=1 Tax=Salipaludibacillus neizhouensis TaxID=885475 RepID=UPI001604143B|nr:hypothetical protein [Salipaludibacillus neizhouensis]
MEGDDASDDSTLMPAVNLSFRFDIIEGTRTSIDWRRYNELSEHNEDNGVNQGIGGNSESFWTYK